MRRVPTATSRPGASGNARCSGWVRVTSIQTGAMVLAGGIPLGTLRSHPDAQPLERARELHFLDVAIAEEAGRQRIPVGGEFHFLGPEHGHHFLFAPGRSGGPCVPGRASADARRSASSRFAAPRNVATKRVAGRL